MSNKLHLPPTSSHLTEVAQKRFAYILSKNNTRVILCSGDEDIKDSRVFRECKKEWSETGVAHYEVIKHRYSDGSMECSGILFLPDENGSFDDLEDMKKYAKELYITKTLNARERKEGHQKWLRPFAKNSITIPHPRKYLNKKFQKSGLINRWKLIGTLLRIGGVARKAMAYFAKSASWAAQVGCSIEYFRKISAYCYKSQIVCAVTDDGPSYRGIWLSLWGKDDHRYLDRRFGRGKWCFAERQI